MSDLPLGALIWLTGYSGAGKSTLARLVYAHLLDRHANTVLLDGDTLRAALYPNVGYSEAERRHLAMCYSRLCQLLVQQGQIVVCATVSLFHEVQAWNRTNIPRYFEVFVRTEPEQLLARNQKNLYTSGDQVMGIHIRGEEPQTPDLIVDNDGRHAPNLVADDILEALFSQYAKKPGI